MDWSSLNNCGFCQCNKSITKVFFHIHIFMYFHKIHGTALGKLLVSI